MESYKYLWRSPAVLAHDVAAPRVPRAKDLGAPPPSIAIIPTMIYQPREKKPLSETLAAAGKRALGGGLPGAAAMGIQVCSLMWLRTTVNYQYRHGTSMGVALRTIYAQGLKEGGGGAFSGVRRFYRGVGPALLQGPLSRFGDTAANAGVLALLDSFEETEGLPVAAKTAAASAGAAGFRIVLMPIDAMKTILQVEGAKGLPMLGAKISAGGPTVLFHGALAASAATFVGHYPWFFTYNTLNEVLPNYDDLPRKLGRSAVIGFSASAVSDTCSNSIRVIKTTKQTAHTALSYPEAARQVIKQDGLAGLFGRGLKTKILSNGLQGVMFSVLWRLGQDWMKEREALEEKKTAAAAG